MNDHATPGQTAKRSFCPTHGMRAGRRTVALAVVLGLWLSFGPVACQADGPPAAPRQATGRVTDARTGEPIEQVTIAPVNGDGVVRSRARNYAGKRFDVELTPGDCQLRFEAEGYRTAMSDRFANGRRVSLLDIRLEPAPAVIGRVVGPDGKPVDVAKVFLATPTQFVSIGPNQTETAPALFTDADGAFAFPAQSERHRVVIVHDSGYAEMTLRPDQSPGEIKLTPWARVEGRLFEAGKPVADAPVYLRPLRRQGAGEPKIADGSIVATDEAGRFVFERVAPMEYALMADPRQKHSSPVHSSESVPLLIKPGEQVTRDLGAGGSVVRGRVAPRGGNFADLVLAGSGSLLAPHADDNAWFDEPVKMFRDGIERGQRRHHFALKLSGDGTFLISGVPAGDYDLVLHLRRGIPWRNPDIVRVRVTDADVARGELDVGLVEVGPADGR